MTPPLIRAYRPCNRPTLWDALSHWREGWVMVLPFAFIWLAMWGSAGL